MIKIAPSILAADSTNFEREISSLQSAGADYIHFDVMDGHFVPNLTFGPKILKEMKSHSNLPFDVHLMVTCPERFIPWYAEAGANIITFHLEASDNPKQTIQMIKNYHISAGISLKPDSNIDRIRPFADMVDLILVMAVEPGFGGQRFRPNTPDRIRLAKEIIGNGKTLVETDGGITPQNAPLCIQAGADILVAGTSVFGGGSYADNIKALKGA